MKVRMQTDQRYNVKFRQVIIETFRNESVTNYLSSIRLEASTKE